jgi:hypothetical protein
MRNAHTNHRNREDNSTIEVASNQIKRYFAPKFVDMSRVHKIILGAERRGGRCKEEETHSFSFEQR